LLTGRPDHLTDANAKVILAAVRTGSTMDTAAAWAGVTGETLRRWRRRGEAAQAVPAGRRNPTDRKYADFCAVLDQALAEMAVRMQEVVYTIAIAGAPTATPENPHPLKPSVEQQRVSLQAATWYLVHRERDTYTTRSEVISPTNGPTELSGAEALAIFRKLATDNPLPDDSDDG
jgi:hypothetical protein